jgi:cytoskeletal protein CcmA (bactofilin family)
MSSGKVNVACPHCGHVQPEAADGYSTVCKSCRQHYRVQDALRPKKETEKKAHDTRQVACFQCGTQLEVAVAAESTMCKRCSTHVDLRNYDINQAVSKNFRTYGSFSVGEKGYVFNTEVDAGDAVIRGRFLGKLHARRTLTLHPGAEFKGTFKAGTLILPAGMHLHWKPPLNVENVEIAGELVTDVRIPGTVTLKVSGRLFGDVEAGNLVVEPGAVLVGCVRIGVVNSGSGRS